jgi:hypothetical protein
MHRSLINGGAAGVGRIFHWPISRQDAIPSNGQSEKKLGQADEKHSGHKCGLGVS